MSDALRIMAIGAHPDDCEVRCGGSGAVWSRAGSSVLFVSVTDGRAGHHALPPDMLVPRRRAEAQAAADVLGCQSRILDFPDGRLEPTIEARETLIRLMRQFQPDLVLTHRPNDYHPDHRVTATLVQDASYLVGVPHVAPDSAPLRRLPAFGYFSDHFQKPLPFSADWVVDIDSALDAKARAVHQHASQFYEWLPWIGAHRYNDPPASDAERIAWVAELLQREDRQLADCWRQAATVRYGPLRGRTIRCIEAFERCEYGGGWSEQLLERLAALG